MFRRLRGRFMKLPLFRMGLALVALSAIVDGLDALTGVGLESLIPATHDAAKVMAVIGVIKIVLRGVLVIASAIPRKGDDE